MTFWTLLRSISISICGGAGGRERDEVPVLLGGARPVRHDERRPVDNGVQLLRARSGGAAVTRTPPLPPPGSRQPSLPRDLRSPLPPLPPPQRRRRPLRAHRLHHRLLHLVPRALPTLPPLLPLLLRPPRRARTHPRILFLFQLLLVFVDGRRR